MYKRSLIKWTPSPCQLSREIVPFACIHSHYIMITTKCEPVEKAAVTSGIRNKDRGREKEEDCIVGISWRRFELPVKRLNAELCGWQPHFADRPWSSPSLSLSLRLRPRWRNEISTSKGTMYRMIKSEEYTTGTRTDYKGEETGGMCGYTRYLQLCVEGAGLGVSEWHSHREWTDRSENISSLALGYDDGYFSIFRHFMDPRTHQLTEKIICWLFFLHSFYFDLQAIIVTIRQETMLKKLQQHHKVKIPAAQKRVGWSYSFTPHRLIDRESNQ